jgi:O-antigen ligase
VRLGLAILCLGLLLPLEVRAAFVGLVVLLIVLMLQKQWRTVLALTVTPVVAAVIIIALGLPLSGRYTSDGNGSFVDRQLSTIPLLLEGRATSTDPNVDTAAWRVAWWTALLGEVTATTDTTLVGLGFGTDLTAPLQAQFGVQLDETGRPTRSPHDIVLTVFARTGAVGLILWAIVLATWAAAVLRGLRRARAVGMHAEANVLLWLASYVLLILIAASLGVVLEGPYGAIPYFLLMGMSLRCARDLIGGRGSVSLGRERDALAGERLVHCRSREIVAA